MSSVWQATFLTLFPSLFPGPLGCSVLGRALRFGVWSCNVVDVRDFASRHDKRVDSRPFGGGAGMVMRPDVVDAALASVAGDPGCLIYLTPRGQTLGQPLVRSLARGRGVKVLCGRYEGIDQRVLDKWSALDVSLGDFILAGGDVAAMALVESVVRLLPGTLGKDASLEEESFEAGLLEYPHYTRPHEWEGRCVPDVLRCGSHASVAHWRRRQAEQVTWERRPDLWRDYVRCRPARERPLL